MSARSVSHVAIVVACMLAPQFVAGCASPASSDVSDAAPPSDAFDGVAFDSGIPTGTDGSTDAEGFDESMRRDVDPDACPRSRPEWGRGGELMLPGGDCLSCHDVGRAATRHPFTVAGTVFIGERCPVGLAGAQVEIEDSVGRRALLSTNAAGNFYTADPLTSPFRFAVLFMGRRREMPQLAVSGSCGSCHGPGHDRPYVSP